MSKLPYICGDRRERGDPQLVRWVSHTMDESYNGLGETGEACDPQLVRWVSHTTDESYNGLGETGEACDRGS